MPKTPNLIQRRELEPLLLKAHRVARQYEKAADCAALVMGPEWDLSYLHSCSLCNHEKECSIMHVNAANEARRLGGSFIYTCPAGFVFWTCPFYSGERYAGAFLSGGVQGSRENSDKVKALAQMMLICADQISCMGISGNFVVKTPPNELTALNNSAAPHAFASRETTPQNKNISEHIENSQSTVEMERILFACLRRGDKTEAHNILIKLLDVLYREAKGSISAFRLKSMELAVLLSRSISNPTDIEDDAVLDTNNRYLKKIEESNTLEEITEILTIITERMSGKIFSFHGVRHSSALRKAERYIWDNYTRKISLKEIAEASGLSAPYFSTIFRDEMGENLSSYLNRLRVEKAAVLLITSNTSISNIAASCGFEDQSWFSKIFKSFTGFTPGKYREQGGVV